MQRLGVVDQFAGGLPVDAQHLAHPHRRMTTFAIHHSAPGIHFRDNRQLLRIRGIAVSF